MTVKDDLRSGSIREKLRGPEHPHVAASLNNLVGDGDKGTRKAIMLLDQVPGPAFHALVGRADRRGRLCSPGPPAALVGVSENSDAFSGGAWPGQAFYFRAVP